MKNSDSELQFKVFADYHQFYLQDGEVFPDAPTDWTDQDVQCRAKAEANVVVICPLRNMEVAVELRVLDVAPTMNLAGVDHAVLCALDLPTGTLQIHECTGGECLRLQVVPGIYRVLAEFIGLDTISADGLDGSDRYRLTVWPGATTPLTVLKTWSGVE